VAERSLAGVFPTNDGEACIWACSPAADAKAIRKHTGSRAAAFEEQLRRSAPQLAERLQGAHRTSISLLDAAARQIAGLLEVIADDAVAGLRPRPAHRRRAAGAVGLCSHACRGVPAAAQGGPGPGTAAA